MSRTHYVAFALITLAACSIPTGEFHASIDAGIVVGGDTGSGHQPEPGVLAIVASATAVTVDEGATKDVTVALSQAPSGPLTVALATTATTKLGISVPTLAFTPTNFSEPQTVTLSGLADVDTIDDHADVTLTASGVDPVTIAATVHDLDQLQIIASGDSPLMVQEGSTVTVNVHLSAQPAGDVAVTALLGAGPVTVSPSLRVFTAANYDVDQVFTFSAPLDADTLASDQSLTFRAATVPDKLLTIHDIDINAQNILVQINPGNATITEETTTAALDVSLSQMPGPSSTVTVAITTTTGAAHVDVTQLTFNAQNYAVKQTVTVSAVADPDTADGSDTIKLHATDPDHGGAALDRTVAITIKDNDTQKILENAPSPLAVTETTSAMFAATLQFKPTGNVVVNVVSLDGTVATASPGTLTFTPADYDQPHSVTVTGVHDNNLVAGTCTVRLSQGALTTDVVVNVADVDQQAFVITPATPLSIAEGGTGTFSVALAFQPTAAVHAVLTSSNAGALPLNLGFIDFTTANWQAAVPVQVHPPVDANNVAETATISVTAAPIPAASISATVVDATQIQTFGWPQPLATTFSILQGQIYTFPVTVPTSSLDSFGMYLPTAASEFRMALYQDVSGRPGPLVAGTDFGPRALVNGTNIADIGDVQIQAGTYWIALRVGATTNVGAGDVSQTGMRCLRNTDIVNLINDWPINFGSATCAPGSALFNLWITTYHQ